MTTDAARATGIISLFGFGLPCAIVKKHIGPILVLFAGYFCLSAILGYDREPTTRRLSTGMYLLLIFGTGAAIVARNISTNRKEARATAAARLVEHISDPDEKEADDESLS